MELGDLMAVSNGQLLQEVVSHHPLEVVPQKVAGPLAHGSGPRYEATAEVVLSPSTSDQRSCARRLADMGRGGCPHNTERNRGTNTSKDRSTQVRADQREPARRR